LIARRIAFAVAALAALAAAAAIFVFAAAFAVFALLRDILTPAGAAAAVALLAAVFAAVVALIAGRKAKAPSAKSFERSSDYRTQTLVDQVLGMARDRPFVAAGAAVAAGLLAIAQPALVTAVMRVFVSPRTPPRR
jgi:hypothetical protein